MFDIVDLNETVHQTKATVQTTISTEEKNNLKPVKKFSQEGDRIGKDVNEEKQNPLTKTEIYKSTDPKKHLVNAAKPIGKITDALTTPTHTETIKDSPKFNINQEFPLFSIVKEPTVFLNRTFRKQPPKPVVQSSEFTDINSLEVQDISNSVEDKTPDMQFENVPQKINNLNVTPKQDGATISMAPIIDIDPKIDILNNNVSAQNNESDIIEFIEPQEIANKTFYEQFLAKTLLGEKSEEQLPETDAKSKVTTEESLEQAPTSANDQPRPNRQRQLTRPQRKTFYPYFFSRVLG